MHKRKSCHAEQAAVSNRAAVILSILYLWNVPLLTPNAAAQTPTNYCAGNDKGRQLLLEGQGEARQGKTEHWRAIYLDQRGDNASELTNIAAHIHSVYDKGAQLPRAQLVLHHQACPKPQHADDTACVALPAGHCSPAVMTCVLTSLCTAAAGGGRAYTSCPKRADCIKINRRPDRSNELWHDIVQI